MKALHIFHPGGTNLSVWRRSFLPIVLTFFVIFTELMILDFHIFGNGNNPPNFIGFDVFALYYLAVAPLSFFITLHLFHLRILSFTTRQSVIMISILYFVLISLMVMGYFKFTYWKIPLFV